MSKAVTTITTRRYIQLGYTALEVADDDLAVVHNDSELIVAVCRDNRVQDIPAAVARVAGAWGPISEAVLAQIPQGLEVRRLLVAPSNEAHGNEWDDLRQGLASVQCEPVDADYLFKQVIAHEKQLLDGLSGRYGRQTDTILNLIKWMVYRNWLKEEIYDQRP